MQTGIKTVAALLGLAATLPQIAMAAEPGDPTRGFAYASSLCGSCHSVAAEGASTVAAAPPLRDAVVADQDGEALARFFNSAHPPAGTTILKDTQAADIIAYVASLRK